MDFHQIFYIDPSEEVDQIKEKIRQSKKNKIILVLPEENQTLKNIESLTILKVEAQRLEKKLTIFSSDSRYRKLAEDCGIELEKSLIEDSFLTRQEVSFRPTIRDILPKEGLKEVTPPKAKEEKEIEKEVEEKPPLLKKPPPKRLKTFLKFIYIFLPISIIVGAIFCFYYLPKAEVTIVPVSDEIEFSSQFTVEKDAEFSLDKRLLPGVLITQEKDVEKSFLATGSEKRVDKAKGKITVYNESGSSHTWVAGTRFKSSDGKIFRSEDWINIPSGTEANPGTVEVTVVAAAAGEEYNIEPTTFRVPALREQGKTSLYEQIYGESNKAMKGGFIGETKVVVKEDITTANQEMKRLQENLIDDAREEVLEKLPSNLQFLEDTVIVSKGKITFDKKIGDIGQTFKGEASVIAFILKFEEGDVQKIIATIISNNVKEGIEFEEVVSSLEVNYEILESEIKKCNIEDEECKMELSFQGKEKVAWKVTAEEVKTGILGKDEQGFENYIKEDMRGKIERAELKLWPFWVNSVPKKENRVFIQVEYE